MGGCSHSVGAEVMKRWRAMTLALAVVVSVVTVAVVITHPFSMTRSVTLTLTAEQSPPWLDAYCLPGGTIFSFSWHSSDGSRVTLEIWSTGLLNPLQYQRSAVAGNGTLFYAEREVFAASNVTAQSVEIDVSLSFSVNQTILPLANPSYGPC